MSLHPLSTFSCAFSLPIDNLDNHLIGTMVDIPSGSDLAVLIISLTYCATILVTCSVQCFLKFSKLKLGTALGTACTLLLAVGNFIRPWMVGQTEVSLFITLFLFLLESLVASIFDMYSFYLLYQIDLLLGRTRVNKLHVG